MEKLVVNFGEGESICIEKTETAKERVSGLLKKQLDEQLQGIWIAPCNSVHSFGMKFAIDLVYLDKKQSVVKVVHNFVPKRMSMSLRSHSIVELYSGAAKERDIQPGMKMSVIERK